MIPRIRQIALLGIACILALALRAILKQPPTRVTSRITTSTNDENYSILTLGGSVTWGAQGQVRAGKDTAPRMENPYPEILNSMPNVRKVDNKAIRATGSDYPSHCIQSMLGDDEAYDVIVLEFSLNGPRGLKMLLARLRARFPDAVIIYVDLYSLQTEASDKAGKSPLELWTRNFSRNWVWGDVAKEHQSLSENYFKKLLNSVGGHLYQLPRHDKPEDDAFMFGGDWHHLSPEGHAIVADGIMEIVQTVTFGKERKNRLGTWGNGDQCINWFNTGDIPLEYAGEAFSRQISPHKHTLGFFGVGYLIINNLKSYSVPLFLAFLTKGEEYPMVDVHIGDKIATVNPKTRLPFHVMRTDQIGRAMPGENTLTFNPVQDGSILPFRLTGVIMCGACDQYQKEGEIK